MATWLPWMMLHLVLAAAGTWLAIRYALRRRLVDQPGARRSHLLATPRGGGIAVVATALFGLAWMIQLEPGLAPALACVAAGLVLVAAVGWIDDHRPLSPWWRLVAQAVAGVLLAQAMLLAGGPWYLAALAWCLVMGLANVWNFMDGIDGLAASQALIAIAGFGLLLGSGPWAWLAAALAAAIAGFLPYNFPKATIFLGDVGSGALGYLVAAMLLAGLQQRPEAWPLILLPVAAFLVDSSFTLLARMLRRERWWEPHVQHAYQGWARAHNSHVRVTLAYALFSLAAVLLMLGAVRLPHPAFPWIGAGWFLIAGCLWLGRQKESSLSKETGP